MRIVIVGPTFPYKGGGAHHTTELAHRLAAAGRRPVVLGGNASDVTPFGPARQEVHLVTRQDEHTLVTPPDGTWRLTINVWMAKPV